MFTHYYHYYYIQIAIIQLMTTWAPNNEKVPSHTMTWPCPMVKYNINNKLCLSSLSLVMFFEHMGALRK